MTKEKYEGRLSTKEIDTISEKISDWSKKDKSISSEYIRLRLSIEEALISIYEKNDKNDIDVSVQLINKFNTTAIVVSYGGVPHNPFSEEESKSDEWTYQMLEKLGQKAIYQIKHNTNRLSFILPKKPLSSEVFIVIAIVSAIIFGLAGRYIPGNIKSNILTFGLNTVTEAFMRLLGVFSGLIIFLALINGMCGMGSVSDFSKLGKKIIQRYLALSFTGGCILTAITSLFYRFKWGGSVKKSEVYRQVKEIIISLFPGNPIEPFLNADMLQIIFLALFMGGLILILDERVSLIRNFLKQINDLVSEGVSSVCKFLPFFIFASFLSMFWSLGGDSIKTLWKPVVAAVITGMVIPAIKLVRIYIRYHMSPIVMIRGLSKTVLIGFTSASSIIAFPTVKEDLNKNFGIDRGFIDFSYPVGLNLYASVYSSVYIVTVFYLAEISNTKVSVLWFVLAWLFCVIFTIATPNVSGGPLICVGVIMNNLNIAQNSIALASTLVILFDFYFTGIRVLCHGLDIYIQAQKFNKIQCSP